jgi:hypothetical protein
MEKKVTFGTGSLLTHCIIDMTIVNDNAMGIGSVLAGELRPKGRGGAPVVFIDPKKNAYMLIYRRVDAARNLLTVDSKEIPATMVHTYAHHHYPSSTITFVIQCKCGYSKKK